MLPGEVVVIDYTNWRGERRHRRIIPQYRGLVFWQSDHHPGTQWLLSAVDCEDNKIKQFAMKGIHSWEPEMSNG